MDPFSITLGVVTLLTTASKAGLELKNLRSGAAEASTINAMLADLKALRGILESIEDGFEDLDGRSPLTGVIGSHWAALKTTLSDGCSAMERLQELLVTVNKEVKLLDSVRRGVRMKEADSQIALYRHEIQAYIDALRLSLQSVMFFQQTTIKEDTTQILKNSEDLHQDITRLITNLEVKLAALEKILARPNEPPNASVKHLQSCARTAASVASSASTVFAEGTNGDDADTWDLSSEFAWLADQQDLSHQLTLRWAVSQSAQSFNAPVETDHLTEQVSDVPTGPPANSPLPTPAVLLQADSADEAKPVETKPDIASKPPGSSAPAVQEKKRKRRMFSLSRFFVQRPKEDRFEAEQDHSSNQMRMKQLKISHDGSIRLKMVFVGAGACGKTCFLIATSTGIFPELYMPTVFENYLGIFELNGVSFECALWDTAGQEDYDELRPLSYPDTNIYCICFAIDNPDSFEDVEEKWWPEINHFKRKTDPVFLLGFKKDLRYDPSTRMEVERTSQRLVTYKEAEDLACKMKAVKYLESSAVKHEGTKETFQTILSMVIEANPELIKQYKSRRWRRKVSAILLAD